MADVAWLIATHQYAKPESFPKYGDIIAPKREEKPKDTRSADDVRRGILAHLAQYTAPEGQVE